MIRKLFAAPLERRLLLALALLLAAHFLRLALDTLFHFPLSPYLAYLTPVVLDALLLGLWPGISATALAAFLMEFMGVKPGAWLPLTDPSDIAALVFFGLVCIAFSIFAGRLRKQLLSPEPESKAALRAIEARFRATFQASQDVMVIAALPDCRSVDVNPRFTSEFGYTREEALGKTSSELGLWANEADHEQLVDSFRVGKPYRDVQVLFRKKNGKTLWGSASAELLELDDEKCVLVSVRNITGEKLAQEALQASEARYRTVFEISPDLLALTRLSDNVLLDVSPSFLKATGYQHEEFVGHDLKEIGIWADFSVRESIRQTVLMGGSVDNLEVAFRRKDGSTLSAIIFATATEIDGEKCVFLCGQDISQLKQAQAAHQRSEELYSSAFHTSTDAMVVTRVRDQVFLDVNRQFCEYFGLSRTQAIGKTSLQVGPWANPADRELFFDRIEKGSEIRNMPFRFTRHDGSPLWGLVSSVPLTIDGEQCVLSSVHDVTKETLAEEARHAIEARYRAAFETSPDAIVISRLNDGMYVDVNPTFTNLTGWKREEVIGKLSREMDIWVDYANRNAMMEILRKGQDFRNVEIQFRRRDGSPIWGTVFATALKVEGEPCLLMQVRDMTNEKKAEEEIRNLAFYDQTTGLANRRLLVEQFRKSTAISARTRRKRALLYLDLDNFKTVNDARGYQSGDMMLRAVADRLLESANPSDTIARIGGDEFVVILEELHVNPELAAAKAMEIAERMLLRIVQPYMLNRVECHTSCSIGITLLTEETTEFNRALQQGEIAMYQAKAAGRNTARFFSPGLQAAVNARATMEDEIRLGLEKNEFTLYFQPQFEGEKLVGAEALLRWKHPRQGVLPPGEFIALAEDTRLIVPLGAWVLENTCKQIAEWNERYPNANITVAANVSALELHRDDFVSAVLDTVSRTGANPRWLELELTETVLVQDVEVAIAKMNALKAHGIRFALDDFGTGYSSLTYLKRLPLAQLKIDRAFVCDLATDPSAGPIIRTIIELSHTLGMRVLAEGVELPDQRAALEQLGCRHFQGYLFSPPLSAADFEQLLAQHSGKPTLIPA